MQRDQAFPYPVARTLIRAARIGREKCDVRGKQRPFHRARGAVLSQHRPPRQNRDHRFQADGNTARPEPGLFAGRRRTGAGHRRRSRHRLRLHRQKQSGRGHHQWHRHPGHGQSGRAGCEAGDGRQGGAVQAFCRCRFDRHRTRQRRPRCDHRRRRHDGAEFRRHQFGRHQGARVLHHRAGAARTHENPGDA